MAAVTRRARGQALVEFVLVTPLFLLLIVGVMALGVVVRTDGAVSAIATEAARAAALASTPAAAVTAGRTRGGDVAQGYGLDPNQVTVNVDTSAFGRGGEVGTTADYTLALNLPLLDPILRTVSFHRVGIEPIAPNRSFR
jgi:Flp pilus assembly protein TadG